MSVLTRSAVARARSYLFEHGRAVDQARYRFRFEAGPAADVVAALSAYQNPDGGFGHALEPDLRTAASSAAATERAFAALREVGAPATDPVVRRGIAYLLDTFDAASAVWEIVPAAVADAPHAPWWSYPDSSATFGGFLLNPTAGLLGALYDYASLVPPALLADLTSTLGGRVAAAPDRIDLNDYRCVVALAATPSLPGPVRTTMRETLVRCAVPAVGTSVPDWSSYGLFPLEVAPEPDSFLAGVLSPEVLAANADFWIDSQLADGSWPLTWDWSAVDGAAWMAAERAVKGYLVVERLAALLAHGRVEPSADFGPAGGTGSAAGASVL